GGSRKGTERSPSPAAIRRNRCQTWQTPKVLSGGFRSGGAGATAPAGLSSHVDKESIPGRGNGRQGGKRTRNVERSARADAVLTDPAAQHLGHEDRAVGLLIVFQEGDQRPADGDRGAVERVDEVRPLLPRYLAADAE